MSRSRSPVPLRESYSILQRITPKLIREFMDDFERHMGPTKAAQAAGKLPCASPDCAGYRPVFTAMHMADKAREEGDFEQSSFLLGMAVAFHGLIRLAKARELEAALAPAMQSSDPAGPATSKPKEKGLNMHSVNIKAFEVSDLADFFDCDDVKYVVDRDKGVLMAGYSGDLGPIHLVARADATACCAHFLFKLPLAVPEPRRQEIASALARANFRLLLGSFEIDLTDGEVNYKVVVPTDDACLSPGQMRHCLGAAFSSISRYMPAFHRIVFDGVSAEDAIGCVES